MTSTQSHRRGIRYLMIGALSAVLLMLGGCLSPKYYVDRGLGDVPAGQIRKVANPHPVQILFEFKTKGATNAKATSLLAPKVMEAVQATQTFSMVNGPNTSGGAVLSIKINNVSLTDDAASRGFITGLTFGASGTVVTDGYTCTIDYLPPGGAAKITKEVRHALHTTIGNEAAPPNADLASTADEAVFKVVRQLVSNGVNQVASDPAFR